MKYAILFLMTWIAQSPVWAQSVCEDLFHIKGVEIDTSEFSVAKQADPAQLNSMTLTILKMTSFSRSSVFTEKYVVEKGELILAAPLNDGWSMEFEYVADYRGPEPVYRLKEIDLVKPNGESTVLDKSPTSTAGDAFKKEFYPLEGLSAEIRDAKIKMPAVILNSLFKNINLWASRAEFIKRHELQGLTSTQGLKKLRGKVAVRSTLDYTHKVIKKQSFKFILLGLAMYFYSQKDVITNDIIKVDPWSKMKMMSDVGLASEEMRARMSKQMSQIDHQPVVLPSPHFTDVEVAYSRLADVLHNIENLTRFERQENSKPVTVYANSKEFSIIGNKKLNALLVDNVFESDSAVLVYFPRTRRIVVISSEWTSFNATQDFVLPYVLEPGPGVQGALYDRLEIKIAKLKIKKDAK